MPTPLCPCGSALRLSACCRRFHRGEEPEDPVTLMRSRFSAFATGEVDYLWRTLHSAHPDRSEGEAAFTASVRRSRQAMKYVRLRVLDHDVTGESGRVLFHAELYEKGKDRSFLELSRFEREGQGWRYLSGEGRALSPSAPALDSLTIATFRTP